MQVKDVMSGKVATCEPTESLEAVARLMKKNDCGAVPVVSDGKVQGIITDRDIVVRAVAEGKNILDLDAASCMTRDVESIDADASLEDCMSLMEKKQIRRVVVMDKKTGIAGIVAQADVALNAPAKETGDVVKKVSR